MGSVVARADATIPGAMLEPLQELLGHLVGARAVALARDDSEPPIPEPPRHDGGLRCAFDSSIIRVLNRVDSVVDDPKLWKPDRKTTRRLTLTDLALRMQRAENQTAVSAAQLRPSVRFGSQLEMSFQDGKAVVVLAIPGGFVTGYGDTFGDALRDFDANFTNGRPTADVGTEARVK